MFKWCCGNKGVYDIDPTLNVGSESRGIAKYFSREILNISIISTSIREDVKPSFVMYGILVVTKNEQWTVWRRYNQFVHLHEQVKNLCGIVPALPPTKYFGNHDPLFIEERKIRLDKYLKCTLQINNIRDTLAFRSFVGAQVEGQNGQKTGMTQFGWSYHSGSI